MITWLLTILGGNIVAAALYHEIEKNLVTEEAYKYARARDKPVLDFGCGFRPRGDYNVDVKPRSAPNFIRIQSFARPQLPFSDKFFGSALAFHVIEHTSNPENAVRELRRTAEKVFILTPKPFWIMSWLQPDHQWIFITNNVYFKNPLYRTREELDGIPLLYPEA